MYLIVLLILNLWNPADIDKYLLRDHFIESYTDKQAAKNFLKLAKAIGKDQNLNKQAYLGIAYIMNSKYGFNPIGKIKKFNKGKKLLNEAIALEPDNIEFRYYRFSVQNNVPGILNYSGQKEEDKSVILKLLPLSLTDVQLNNMIISYLRECECLNSEELLNLEKQ